MGRIPHKPFLIVVSAPSGTGKTTVCRRALNDLNHDRIRFSVSHTTRPRRTGEVDRQDYHFVDEPAFREMVAAGEFLEWANVYGNHYGTSRGEVRRAADEAYDLIVEIDVQGARQIMEQESDAVSVFILPPSLAELERRLRDRETDSDEVIARRLEEAAKELREAGRYDYWIVNDELDAAVDELAAIVKAERQRQHRMDLGGHPLQAVIG